MSNELIHMMTETFEGHAQETENGIEYWLARDLQHLLGYAEWRNFLNVVSKAKTACDVSGHGIRDHFVDTLTHAIMETRTLKRLVYGENSQHQKNKVDPVEGSKMHRLSETKDRWRLRSQTPIGFARAFFNANP